MEDLIFELKRKQIRHSRKEKDDFIEFLKQKLHKHGFEYNVVQAKVINSIHLETVSESDPDVILMAHYDTSNIMPVWYEWLIRLCGHTRSLLTLLIFILVDQLLHLTNNDLIIRGFEIVVVLTFIIPVLFIKNKHTMNDNTSGVIALLLLAEKISKNETLKKRVKIVFTDNEEKMLLGSFQLRRIWKKNSFSYKNTKIISIDSIGRGDYVVISYNIVNRIANELNKMFAENQINSKSINMWVTPFSDAYNFWFKGAVNINMMSKTIIPGGYYIKNIHSYRDKEISKDNIRIIVESLEKYIITCSNMQYRQ